MRQNLRRKPELDRLARGLETDRILAERNQEFGCHGVRHLVDDVQGNQTDQSLDKQFHLAGNAVADAPFVFDLDIVVVKTERGQREQHNEKYQDHPVREISPEDCGNGDCKDDEQSAHRRRLVLGMIDEFLIDQSFEPCRFRHAEFLQLPDGPRSEENHQQHCCDQRSPRAEGHIFEQAQRTETVPEFSQQIKHGSRSADQPHLL